MTHRSKRRNKFLRDRTDQQKRNHSKQRNFCHFFGNQKVSNITEKKVTEKKSFWKPGNLFQKSWYKIRKNRLVENEKIIDKEREIAEVLNTFFCNIVSNLNMAEYSNSDPLANEISLVLKAVVKCGNHPSILKTGEECKKTTFSFSHDGKDENFKEILSLENAKACQISKTLSKIIKENTDAPIKYLFSGFNNSPIKPEFPKFFKSADITPLFKKAGKNRKKTVGQ